jgi:hypothetical protein
MGMRNRRKSLVVWCAAALAGALGGSAWGPRRAAAEEDGGPAGVKGKLDEVAPVLRRLIPLTVDQARLRIDREAWERPAEEAKDGGGGGARLFARRRRAVALGDDEGGGVEAIFHRLRSAAGANSSGESSSNDDRTLECSGGGLAVRLRLAGQSVRIELREEKEPGRALDVHDDGDGAFQLIFRGAGDNDLLVLHQSRAGRFSMSHLKADKPFTAGGSTFLEFYRAHRDYVDQQLIPSLSALGAGAFPSAASPAVRRAVLERLRPFTDAERAEVDRLIGQLDDADHAKREEATQRLMEHGVRHGDWIEAARKAPNLSPEAATRLDRVLTNVRPRRRADALAAALGLAEDPACLVRLLGEAPETDRPHVAAALERITGQKLGLDPAAWEAWWKERQKGK